MEVIPDPDFKKEAAEILEFYTKLYGYRFTSSNIAALANDLRQAYFTGKSNAFVMARAILEEARG